MRGCLTASMTPHDLFSEAKARQGRRRDRSGGRTLGKHGSKRHHSDDECGVRLMAGRTQVWDRTEILFRFRHRIEIFAAIWACRIGDGFNSLTDYLVEV